MDSPFVCDLAAMSPEQRARHRVLAVELRGAAKEIRELPNGYAARFSTEPSFVMLIAEFITLERLCCPFFTLGLEVESDLGPLWMKVTGPEGIKPFIRVEFGIEP